MAVFTYKALDTQRVNVSGMITADTPRQARDILRAEGLAIQEVAHQKAQSKRSRQIIFRWATIHGSIHIVCA